MVRIHFLRYLTEWRIWKHHSISPSFCVFWSWTPNIIFSLEFTSWDLSQSRQILRRFAHLSELQLGLTVRFVGVILFSVVPRRSKTDMRVVLRDRLLWILRFILFLVFLKIILNVPAWLQALTHFVFRFVLLQRLVYLLGLLWFWKLKLLAY